MAPDLAKLGKVAGATLPGQIRQLSPEFMKAPVK